LPVVAPTVRPSIGDGEIAMAHELPEARFERLEGGTPFRLRRL